MSSMPSKFDIYAGDARIRMIHMIQYLRLICQELRDHLRDIRDSVTAGLGRFSIPTEIENPKSILSSFNSTKDNSDL